MEQVWIPGGEFAMGSQRHYPDEGPVRHVTVEGFWMDATTVTNADFAAFVAVKKRCRGVRRCARARAAV